MKSITRMLIGIFCLLVSSHALAEPQKVLIKTSMGEITVELDASHGRGGTLASGTPAAASPWHAPLIRTPPRHNSSSI